MSLIEDKLKKLQDRIAEQEAKKGTLDNRQRGRLARMKKDEENAAKELADARLEEKEATDELKADQERLKQLEQSLDPQKQLEKPTPPDAKAADAANQAANDNKSNVTIQQNDNRQNQSTEQKTVVEQNKELSGTGSAAALSRAVETAL